MNRMLKYQFILLLLFAGAVSVFAGNPDRQGQAGAYELTLNPWARSSGLHTINTSFVRGVEAIRLNVAGLARIDATEIVLARSNYLQGSQIYFNSLGIAQRVGKNGVIGISLMAIDFGDIPITTYFQPEGIGADFSPTFFNLGLSYGHLFDLDGAKISIGITARAVSESNSDVTAQGLAIDGGIQYSTGPQDNFKFGVSLRNQGTPLQFKGEGLTFVGLDPEEGHELSVNQRSSKYEMPSLLNIGASYDFRVDARNRITIAANFRANSFSQDELGAGLEYSFREMFAVRAAYKAEIGQTDPLDDYLPSIFTGLAAGASIEVPLGKESSNKLGIDYSYRATNPFEGTHSLGLRISI